MMNLLDKVKFAFQVNFHSYGPYLLYPEGWQIGTPTADDPIYYALSGNLSNPAIPDFYPGIGSDVLYVTNGESTDFAHLDHGTLAWTPELEEGCTGCGFVFPDDEALVQAEFEKVLPFAQDVVASAARPGEPGRPTSGSRRSRSTWRATTRSRPASRWPTSSSRSPTATRRRCGCWRSATSGRSTSSTASTAARSSRGQTDEYNGGERYGGKTDVYYHVVERPGDGHEGRATPSRCGSRRRRSTSPSFTYTSQSTTQNKVLVVAAEDYSGASPVQTPGPHYLQYYLDALAANGIQADVYDVDANGRTAPDDLGVLSHYKAVIWYTGDDTVTREPGWGAGERVAARDGRDAEHARVHERGRPRALDGQERGRAVHARARHAALRPDRGERAVPRRPGGDRPRCLALSGSGDGQNDVLEYWFGAFILNYGAGLNDAGDVLDVLGIGQPAPAAADLELQRPGQRGQPDGGQLVHHDERDPAAGARTRSSRAGRRRSTTGPGGPFDPHTGSQYVYSQIADVSYKRLSRTLTVPAAGGDLSFWTSYNTEADWDHLFVEVHTVGQDDWTTLPDMQRAHVAGDRRELQAGELGRLAHAAPVPRPLPDADGPRQCAPDRHDRCVERGVGRLRRLAAVAGEPRRVRRASRSRCRSPTRATGPRRGSASSSTTSRYPDGTSTSFESGLDGWSGARLAGGLGGERERLRARSAPPASRRARSSPRTTRCTWASASRASRPPRAATRSWAARWSYLLR